MGLLLAAIAIRYAFQINIPRILLTVIIILIAMLGDRNEIISLIICCIPLHEAVNMFYSLVGCISIYLLKFHQSIRVNSSILALLLMLIWELLHCLVTSFSGARFLSTIIPLIVLAVFMCMDMSELDYPLVVRTLSYATLSVAVTLFLNQLYRYDYNVVVALANLKRLGIVLENDDSLALTGALINPNSVGIVSVLCATGLIQIRNLQQRNLGNSLLIGALMLFGALTASRTYLACLAAMMILLIMAGGGTIEKKIRFIVSLAVMMVLVFLVLSIVFPDLLEYYISRFTKGDISTGRFDLMQAYHKYIMDNPGVLAFGIGLQDYGFRLVEAERIAINVPHNAIQEVIIAWGIPGIALFALIFFYMYRASGRLQAKNKLLHSIPLLIILLKGMAGQMLTSAYTLLALSYAYLSLCADLLPNQPNGLPGREMR